MRTIGGIKIPDEDSYKIQSTFKYEMFSFIEGNRSIDHDEKIEKSIRKSGLLVQPILVNQSMQIIDGQNRFEACKRLCLPIYYVVQDGVGLGEVNDLNSASKNWTARDYIHSYAAGERNVNYMYIEQLFKAYPWATRRIIAFAMYDFGKGFRMDAIKNGRINCTEAEYNKAVGAMDYASQFRDMVNGIGGRKEHYYVAIMFCYFCEDIDNEYLLQKFKKYHKSLSPVLDTTGAVTQIETKVYNYQLRAPREPLSILGEYERAKRASKNARNNEE